MRKIKDFRLFTEGLAVDAAGNLEIPYYLMSDDSDNEDDAYDKGIAALSNGYESSDNPYDEEKDSILWDAWNDGFSQI